MRLRAIGFDSTRLDEAEASEYVQPFAYVVERVKPVRATNRRASRRNNWLKFGELAIGMRNAIEGLDRYLVTPHVSKHRLFTWVPGEAVPSNLLVIMATDDDYAFGVLHSRIHEVWALAQGTSLEDRPRYAPSTCFETFPFPEPTETQREAVAGAAKYLFEVRSHLLSSDPKLTMTKLYNEVESLKSSRDVAARAFPLQLAHERLDEAVAAAYGWEWPLSDEEVLGRLLGLNLERSMDEDSGASSDQPSVLVTDS